MDSKKNTEFYVDFQSAGKEFFKIMRKKLSTRN